MRLARPTRFKLCTAWICLAWPWALRTFILTTMRQGPPWIQRYRNDKSGRKMKDVERCGKDLIQTWKIAMWRVPNPVSHFAEFCHSVAVFFSETGETDCNFCNPLLEGAFDPGRSCPGSAAQTVEICSSAYCPHS